MKLIVNLSALQPPLTGIGHYTKEMLRRVINDGRVSDVQGFLYARWLNKAQIEELLADGGGATNSKLKAAVKKLISLLPYNRKLIHSYMRALHKDRFEELGEYVYWEPNYMPLFVTPKTAVSVYDLSHIRYPEFHPKERVKALESGIKRSVNAGATIVTISEFSREEIADRYKIDAQEIKIAPPGTASSFGVRSEDEIADTKKRYEIEGKYILSVCTVEPRKNLLKVCEAYSSLDDEVKKKYKLVLVGKSGWLNDELEKILKPLEQKGQAIRCGYVQDNELPALYGGASVFVYMSLYEGYGMPVAEAIRCGTPTLASSKEPMIGVGGDKAIYADPMDSSDIKQKLAALLNGNIVSNVDRMPQIFEWEECADMLVGAFLEIDKR
jgi:alpha-1,3-rhamnosyl/mannosyltransferase